MMPFLCHSGATWHGTSRYIHSLSSVSRVDGIAMASFRCRGTENCDSGILRGQDAWGLAITHAKVPAT